MADNQPSYPPPRDVGGLGSFIPKIIPKAISALSDTSFADAIRTTIERTPIGGPGTEPGDWNKMIELRKLAMQSIKDQGLLTDEGYAALEEAVANFEGPFQKWQSPNSALAYFENPINAIYAGAAAEKNVQSGPDETWLDQVGDEAAMEHRYRSTGVEELVAIILHEFGHYLDWNPEGGGMKGHIPTGVGGGIYSQSPSTSMQMMNTEADERWRDPEEVATDYRPPVTDFDVSKYTALAYGADPKDHKSFYKWANPMEHVATVFEEAVMDSKKGLLTEEARRSLDENPWMREIFERVIPKESLDVAHEAASERYYESPDTGLEGERKALSEKGIKRFIEYEERKREDAKILDRGHYTIKPNDTLSKLSERFNISVGDLKTNIMQGRLGGYTLERQRDPNNPDKIYEGDIIVFPPESEQSWNLDKSDPSVIGEFGEIQSPIDPWR